MSSMMPHFDKVENPEGTYHVECQFTVYRARFGHHPSFLPQDEMRGRREGFCTQFWFLVDDDLSAKDADARVKELTDTYDELIDQIQEDDSRWEEFPFKGCPVVYAK